MKKDDITVLSTRIQKVLKRIKIRTKILTEELISGGYNSAFKGRGIEFSDVREYTYGDDTRDIDWNVTARMNKPFIKTYKEERELSIIIMIDTSSSTLFGSENETIRNLMIETSALFCLAAIASNDMVGGIIFSDKVIKYLPPTSGEVNILKVLKNIAEIGKYGGKTDISTAIDFLIRLKLKKSIVLLLSDFIDYDFNRPVKILSKKHDLIPIIYTDPIIKKLNYYINAFTLVDIEGYKGTPVFRKDILEMERKYRKRYKVFSDLGIRFIEITTDGSILEPIADFFRSRILQQ